MGPRPASGERTAIALVPRLIFALALMIAGSRGSALLFSTDRVAAAWSGAARAAYHGFDGVGRIECSDGGEHGTAYRATAWVVGSADTVVTAAHLFFGDGGVTAGGVRRIDPGSCSFVLYDADQHVRDTAKIRYIMSPWAQRRLRFDSSYDVAVLKLDRLVRVSAIPQVRVASRTGSRFAELIAFHSGVPDPARPRLTRGMIGLFPASQLRFAGLDMRITRASHLFATSADATQGSSGGMYYDVRAGAAFGLHIGGYCDTAQSVTHYDPASCFNYGLRFDAKAVEMITAAVRDTPIRAETVLSRGLLPDAT